MDENLVQGIAVIVDDQVGVQGSDDKINEFVKLLESRFIPCVKYKYPPVGEETTNFHGISFIVLDWMFTPEGAEKGDIEHGVRTGGTSAEDAQSDVIQFIKKAKEECFAPIFVLTSENIETVKTKLKEYDIDTDGEPNFIHIKNKKEFNNVDLISYINDWIKNNPSIYVLSKWDNEYSKAKSAMFSDLYDLSPSWPVVLWKSFEKDGADQSEGLENTITANLRSRMVPFKFSNELFDGEKLAGDKEETRKVLSGERFVKNDRIHGDSIEPGDLFKKGQKYYLNIRPICDLVPRDGKPLDQVELFLLSTDKISEEDLQADFQSKFGNFIENDATTVIPFVEADLSLRIKFKNMKIEKWEQWKARRIGRLIPPYVTRVQQRYSHYLQRQGLPRIPDHAVPKE